MPYSTPGTTTTTVIAPENVPFPSQGQGRAGHRRSFSHITAPPSLATTSTTGAFSSLGSLPTRRRSAPSTPMLGTPNRKATFQLGRDDDDDSPDESIDDVRPRLTIKTHNIHDDDDDQHAHLNLPPLRLKTKPISSFDNMATRSRSSPPPPQIMVHASHTQSPVPFPRSSPLPSPQPVSGTSFLPFPHGKRSPTTSESRYQGLSQPASPRPIRPSVSRTSSHPIILSTGKPLKSSLKSSSSSPNIPFPPQSLVPSIMFPQLHQPQPSHHQRARSAPSTPHLGSIADPMESAVPSMSSGTSESDPSSSPPLSPSPSPSPPPSKNVHFPSQEEGGLTTVKLFNRTAKPASLLRIGDETETETEGENSSAPTGFGWGAAGRWGGYAAVAGRGSASPFPKVSVPSPMGTNKVVLGDVKEEAKETNAEEIRFEIDMNNSSPIPARGAERAEGNVYFESLGFVCEAGTDKPAKPLTLTGTLLVRNVTFQKTVAVRFTLDDWHTTNDVVAKHEKSLTSLPERFLLASLPLADNAGSEAEKRREVVCRPFGFEDDVTQRPDQLSSDPMWDRFRFEVSLANYESTLESRTMFFVGRYTAGMPLPPSAMHDRVDGTVTPPPEEWWDNNCGSNYRISFSKRVVVDRRKEEEEERKKREAAAAPSVLPMMPVSAVPPSIAAGYRRNVAYSAPPVFSPSKPYPAPPQISSSNSFPAPSPSPQQRQQAQEHQAALTQSTLARLKKLNLRNYAAPAGSGYTGSPVTAASFAAASINRGAGDDHARALSTSSTSSTDSTSSNFSTATNSTNTSTDSTPLHTPTQGYAGVDDDSVLFKGVKDNHDVNVNVLGDEEDSISSRRVGFASEEDDLTESSAQSTPTFRGSTRLPARWGNLGSGPAAASPPAMEDGFPANGLTSRSFNLGSPPSMGAEVVSPTLPSMQPASMNGLMSGTPSSQVVMEMGTSPPFSAMAGMEMAGRGRNVVVGGAKDNEDSGFWPWGSFTSTKVEKKAPVTDEESEKELSAPVASLLEGIKERNMSPPPTVPTHAKVGSGPPVGMSLSSNTASNPLAPPQRRKGHGHQSSTSFTLGGSSSSSPSGSGSESTRNAHQRQGARWKGGVPAQSTQPQAASAWPLSPSHQIRPMSPVNANSSRPLSPVQNIFGQNIGRSSTPPFPGTSSPNKRFFPALPRTDSSSPLRISPVNSNLSISTIPSGFNGPEQPLSPGSTQDDALYQAFVRQWCFAQGPTPATSDSTKERKSGNVAAR
ncbi:hypothetical protein CPB83DRAFT_894656 [Crepidotus variabilis]|uniref:CBM21 domain-containing protein n=1 Tax=Crepidotus variabilis TaxID=179855 RepID=A0A9P6EFR1_9AGAR|nr:hypothetical protein CPB83DRAFT_894656 [Crepidotus variabilis]